MTKRGEWDRMPELIDDELVQTFAVVGTPEEAIAEIKRRYGDIATRITLQLPAERDEERWRGLFDELRAS
jgi:alkanesulfonate monooxygenase SsuD/methylene tetrahydromethanopterin reductase-like flavin-dependent oxidoreductase (luciferase family)